MKRSTAKDILAFWLYKIRCEAELEHFGNADSDQADAERIIRFFEDMSNPDSDTCRDWIWEQKREDYKDFQGVFDAITEGG